MMSSSSATSQSASTRPRTALGLTPDVVEDALRRAVAARTGAIADASFAVDRTQVGLDRLLPDDQFRGNAPVRGR